MFDSGLSETNKRRVHGFYELKMDHKEIANRIGTDLVRIDLEIRNYERAHESKSYIDRMAASLAAMIW